MKVGDLVVYRRPTRHQGSWVDPKQFGIVLSEKDRAAGSRVFRVYFPHFDHQANVWEEEYKVVSESW